jgi:hypothetical protein
MGADLYIPKLRAPVEAEWKPKFEAAAAQRDAATDDESRTAAQKLVNEAYDKRWGGDHYFRDSYNSTSVLWRMGLSWWQDMEYDVKYDEATDSYPGGVNVSPDACRRFLEKVQSAEFRLPTRGELIANHAKVDDGENSVESWHKFYTEKRDRLIVFLKRAIENGGLYASC